MNEQRKKAAVILNEILDLHPEFLDLPTETMMDLVDRHISYIIAEMAVFQKHTEQNKEKADNDHNTISISDQIIEYWFYDKKNCLHDEDVTKIKTMIDQGYIDGELYNGWWQLQKD